MKSLLDHLVHYIQSHPYLAPCVAAGLVDWLAKPRQQTGFRWLTGLLSHIVIAVFFGWFTAQCADLLGHEQQGIVIAAATGALLGAEVSRIIMFIIDQHIGRKRNEAN